MSQAMTSSPASILHLLILLPASLNSDIHRIRAAWSMNYASETVSMETAM